MTTEITRIINGFKQFSETPYVDSINFLKDYIEVEQTDEAFFELGKALFFNEEYGEAIECLKKSDDYRCDAYIGLAYFKMEEFTNAARHFKRFLKDNQNETILSYLMISYEKNREWRNAVECGERILETNPKSRSIKIHLIDCHSSLRQYQKALDYMDEISCRGMEYRKGEILFNLKRYEDAIEVLKELETIDAYKLMAKSYVGLKKPSKAIRCLQNSYKKDPDIEILFEISKIAFENKYHNQAVSSLEMALAMDGENEMALERLAEIHHELNNFDSAIEYCEKLMQINENNISAYIIMSNTYYYMDDNEKALEVAEKGLDIDPDCADLWVRKAGIYYLYDFSEFKRCLEMAVRLEPNNIKNYITLIRQCLWQDEEDNARRYYEKLIFYNPAFSESFDDVTKITRILKEKILVYSIY